MCATTTRSSWEFRGTRAGCSPPSPTHLHDLGDDGLEDALVARVVDAVVEGEVHGVVLARARAHVAHRARAGEEVAELVEGDAHDAVRRVEGLLHAVAVVDVDVDVQHARVVLQQLQDAQHDVVHVAEARRLALLRVVQPARPVHRDVRVARVQPHGAVDGRPRVHLAEAKQDRKDGAVRELAAVDCAGRGGGGGAGAVTTAQQRVAQRRVASGARCTRAHSHEHRAAATPPVTHTSASAQRTTWRSRASRGAGSQRSRRCGTPPSPQGTPCAGAAGEGGGWDERARSSREAAAQPWRRQKGPARRDPLAVPRQRT